jgi:hypothetical protein
MRCLINFFLFAQSYGGRLGVIPSLLCLQYGFLMGLEHYQLVNTAIPPNHYKSVEHEQFVLSKYAEEIELGCISLAFSSCDNG